MKTIFSTALTFNQRLVTYEIMRSLSMLVFRPAYYFEAEDFPCIILTRSGNAWTLRDDVDVRLKEQVMDDIALLKI